MGVHHSGHSLHRSLLSLVSSINAAGFKAWKTPTFEYCSADGCWDYSVQWMYFTAYLCWREPSSFFTLLPRSIRPLRILSSTKPQTPSITGSRTLTHTLTRTVSNVIAVIPMVRIWNAPPKKQSNLRFPNAARNVSVTKWQAHRMTYTEIKRTKNWTTETRTTLLNPKLRKQWKRFTRKRKSQNPSTSNKDLLESS